jgi:predicted DsbA family dithiol-disulfide isomerase
MAGTRRDLLTVGAVIAAVGLVTARPWTALRTPEPEFRDLQGLPPLRRLSDGPAAPGGSATGAVFAGLDRPSAAEAQAMARLRAAPCAALGLPWEVGAPLPVTYFTDIACPSCRRLEPALAALAETVPFRLVTREFPVFGARSEAAARAIIAAASLGAGEAMRLHLRTRPLPQDADGLTRLASALDLDPAAFLSAWTAPETAARLTEDRALARLLGLPGTPGLVLGRTLVIGNRPPDLLARVLDRELQDGPPPACS